MQIPVAVNSHAYPIAPSKTTRSPIDKNSKLYKASQEFEALFIKQMLDVMRKTIHKEDDLLGGWIGQDVYEDMLYDEYSKKMAATGQFGIADMIYKQLSSK
jgi:flagellar protein FlgJ